MAFGNPFSRPNQPGISDEEQQKRKQAQLLEQELEKARKSLKEEGKDVFSKQSP
jgi:hypothetical protein